MIKIFFLWLSFKIFDFKKNILKQNFVLLAEFRKVYTEKNATNLFPLPLFPKLYFGIKIHILLFHIHNSLFLTQIPILLILGYRAHKNFQSELLYGKRG